MSIVLMMLLGLICVQESLPNANWPEPPRWLDAWLGNAGSLLATVACLGFVWLIGSVLAQISCRTLERDPTLVRTVRRHAQKQQKIYFLVLAGAFLFSLYSLGWGHFIRASFEDKDTFLPGKELVLMAPFLLALLGSWARFYDVEHKIHEIDSRLDPPNAEQTSPSTEHAGRKLPWWRVPIEQFVMLGLAPRRKAAEENTGLTPVPRLQPGVPSFLSRGAYVGLQARFNLLLIMPPLALMLMQQLVLWFFPGLRRDEAFLQYFLAGFLIVALLSLPWLLRLFLGLRPMPAGPLRDRLEGTIRRLKFRCSDILLWNTRNSSANAMVTGLLPWPRYIVLTDQLLRDLSAEEVEAVLGHEIGHVKHHHMFYFMMFLFGSLAVLGTLWDICNALLQSDAVNVYLRDHAPFVENILQSGRTFQAFPATLALGLYLFVVFGYLSRCCETQADIYGSRTVSTQAFISALEKVALLNNIPREKPGWISTWRHPTIANRVDFLQRMTENPDLEPRFQRRIGRFKWSLALILSLLLAAIWYSGGIAKPKNDNPPADGVAGRS